MSASSILITGATGNVGLETARLLAARGVAFTAAARAPERAAGVLPPAAPAVAFDFEKPETFEPALQGVRKVLLVRPPAISDIEATVQPFLAAAERAGVEHVVFLSLLGAERIKVVPHRRIEEALLRGGMAHTFLRASFFMQNLTTTHRDDIRRGEIVVPAGSGRTSFIDVRDIAEVGAAALLEPGHAGKAYELTGAEALRYDEAVAILSDVLGRTIRYRRPSLMRFARHMRREGHPWGFILVMAGIYTTARLGLAAEVAPDVQRVLGRPPISFRQFAEDYREAWAPA